MTTLRSTRSTTRPTARKPKADASAMSTADSFLEVLTAKMQANGKLLVRLSRKGSNSSPQARHKANLLRVLRDKEQLLLMDLNTVRSLRRIVGRLPPRPSGPRSPPPSKPRSRGERPT